MASTRPAPSLTIHIPHSSHTRSSSAPAFGLISTYSHRIPRPPRQSSIDLEGRDSLDSTFGSDSDPFELEKVTVAQVSRIDQKDAKVFGGAARQRCTPVHHISFGVEPPTPSNEDAVESISDPVVCRKSSPFVRDTIKQQRRTASIYSVCSSTADMTHGNSLTLMTTRRPTSISLAHTNVSSESLVVQSPPESTQPHIAIPVETVSSSASNPHPSNDIVSSVVHPFSTPLAHRPTLSTSSNLSSSSSPPSNLPRTLPSHPRHPEPSSSSTSTISSRPRQDRIVVRPDETVAAERLKRLYLCPWETQQQQQQQQQQQSESSMDPRKRNRTIDGNAEDKVRNRTIVNVRGSDGTGGGGQGGEFVQRKLSLREKFEGRIRRSASRRNNHEKENAHLDSIIVEAKPSYEASPDDLVVRSEEDSKMAKQRKEATLRFVKFGFIGLFSLIILVDLVVINVKVFGREDWE